MRFYTVLASRPAYYDRGASASGNAYIADGTGPHATTTRWTYTVPAASSAFVESAEVLVTRDGVASSAAYVEGYVQYQPAAAGDIRLVDALVLLDTVGSQSSQNTGAIGLLSAGDVLKGITRDTSTGGSVSYRVAAKWTQFNV